MTAARKLSGPGGPWFGAWCHIPSAFSAELIARAGFDWVCIDTQHGLAGYEAMVAMLQAMQVVPVPVLVRVTSNDAGQIGRALDAGAAGVIVPLVESAADALRAIRACRYAPAGSRSWGPIRAALDRPDYTPRSADDEVICTIQLETRAGVANADEILATPGIDAVYVGPNDLAISHALDPTGDPTQPEHIAAIETILDACVRNGVTPGIHCGTVAIARHWIDRGFRMVNVASDALFMRRAAAETLAALRAHANDGSTSVGRRDEARVSR
jgi:4-hydroxy-2-oxoheptanedioate aldolase